MLPGGGVPPWEIHRVPTYWKVRIPLFEHCLQEARRHLDRVKQPLKPD